MNPLVTVCITTFNRKHLLRNTLNSVLFQTYKHLEIIIVDDCSVDGTREFVKNEILPIDNRLKFISHEVNRGLASARNSAIFNANGKFFTFCDDDDIWNPLFIEEFVRSAEEYDLNWCFCCGGIYKNNSGTQVNVVPVFEGELKDYIKLGFTPPVAAQFYTLDSLVRVSGYNEKISSGVDHDLWIRLAMNNLKIKCLSKPLTVPNADRNLERMTLNYEKRLRGIKNSLTIWKSDLETLFGDQFYLDFRKAYIERERLKFFKYYLYLGKISVAYRIGKKLPIGLLLHVFIKALIKVIFNNLISRVASQKNKVTVAKPVLKINS